MKKLILSLQFLSMLFALPCSTYPMFDSKKKEDIEMNRIISPYNHKPSLIDKLSGSMQDRIAQYLSFNDRESDAEFFKRTQSLLKNKEFKHVCKNGYIELTMEFNFFKDFLGFQPDNIVKVYSHYTKITNMLRIPCISSWRNCRKFFECAPHFSKAILLEDSDEKTRVNMFDLIARKRIYTEEWKRDDKLLSDAVALSSDGTKFALVEKIEDSWDSLLKIKDIVRNEIETIIIPVGLAERVDFNKQGTKIIIQNKEGRYIHPLADKQEHALKTEKTLAAYFRQKGIRKQSPQQDQNLS